MEVHYIYDHVAKDFFGMQRYRDSNRRGPLSLLSLQTLEAHYLYGSPSLATLAC